MLPPTVDEQDGVTRTWQRSVATRWTVRSQSCSKRGPCLLVGCRQSPSTPRQGRFFFFLTQAYTSKERNHPPPSRKPRLLAFMGTCRVPSQLVHCASCSTALPSERQGKAIGLRCWARLQTNATRPKPEEEERKTEDQVDRERSLPLCSCRGPC